MRNLIKQINVVQIGIALDRRLMDDPYNSPEISYNLGDPFSRRRFYLGDLTEKENFSNK